MKTTLRRRERGLDVTAPSRRSHGGPDGVDATPRLGCVRSLIPRPKPGEGDRVEDARALLADLVAIDSINPSLVPGGAGEGEIARFVGGWLSERGLEVDIADVEPGRPNVVARTRGKGGGRSLLLLRSHGCRWGRRNGRPLLAAGRGKPPLRPRRVRHEGRPGRHHGGCRQRRRAGRCGRRHHCRRLRRGVRLGRRPGRRRSRCGPTPRSSPSPPAPRSPSRSRTRASPGTRSLSSRPRRARVAAAGRRRCHCSHGPGPGRSSTASPPS